MEASAVLQATEPTGRQPSASSNLRVLIAGGGIGGLTAAIALEARGHDVVVLERRSEEEMLAGPGGIFIQLNAMRVFDLLGLAEDTYGAGGRVGRGGFLDQSARELYINDPSFAGASDLGACIGRTELQQILRNAVKGDVRCSAGLAAFTESETCVRVQLTDGTALEGDVLIGADGIGSKVRSILDGGFEPPCYSGTTCWRGFFDSELVSTLPSKYTWGELWGCGCRFGWFDVGHGRKSFYAFQSVAAGNEDNDTGCRKARLQRIFTGFASPVPEIISALDESRIHRSDVFDRSPRATPWGRGRVTLLGDAAHPSQPSIGQGGCMAIEDAFELSRFLSGNDNNETIVQQLRAYEKHRSARTARVIRTSRVVSWLGQQNTRLGAWVRDTLYWLTPTWLGDLQFRWLFDYQPQASL